MGSSRVRRVSYLRDIHPSQERLFNLMGESLLLQTNTSLLIDIAEEAFGRFPITNNLGDNPLIIRLYVQEETNAEATSVPSTVMAPVYHHQAHLFSIHAGAKSYALADLKSGFAYGFITPDLLREKLFVRIHFVEALAFSLLGVARGYVGVHAACVVKDGLSFLLFGGSGHGKSSTAFACLRRGYQILAEDVVFIKTQARNLQLWGSPWKFHLLPDAEKFFPDLLKHGCFVQYGGTAKIELDLEELYPGSTITRSSNGVILILSRDIDQPLSIEKISGERAYDEFTAVWPWEIGWDESMEYTCQRLLENGVYRFNLNGTPDQAVDALDAFIGQFQEGRR